MQKLFKEIVYDIVRQIPSGKVATYGQIAALAGNPKSARAVGNALHNNPDPLFTPCFRIVNSQGLLARSFGFGGRKKQREMLENDGITVVNYRVDLCTFQWDGSGFLSPETLCPVCCKHHFSEKNSYEICPVCGWEDDPIQRKSPDFSGGANEISLNQARIILGKKGIS